MSNLVVVESPTKTKTLAKYLGKDFEIKASLGHIKDLPKSKLGVDVENDFEPEYDVPATKKKVVKELKDAAKTASTIYLATDPDREGEAIAAHVLEELPVKKTTQVRRVVFHEITKEAVDEAFKNPREIDFDLVNAQKARRVLDRLVGYKLSPLLWKKVRYGLSAGRVQSVALRLVVERERERQAFNPEEYWTVEALLAKQKSAKEEFTANLIQKNDEKIEIKNQKQVDSILKDLENVNYVVKTVKIEEKKRYPSPPFTTSTLQQAAFNLLGFPAKRTMRAAQALYEEGLITYHRTDSTNLAASALTQIRSLIKKQYGANYLPESAIHYKTKAKVAQEAHEAVRVTNVNLPHAGSGDAAKLYNLIWGRTVACQMVPAVFDAHTVDINAGNYTFRANGQVLKFNGFLAAMSTGTGKKGKLAEPDSETSEGLPELAEGEKLTLKELDPSQHFTEPPARYTEATLVKELEKHGIGRPSTYAPTLATLKDRGYVAQEGRALKPEDVAFVVTDLLVEHFPEVIDLSFTANMEDELDGIARGEKEWVPIIRDFYTPFENEVEVKTKELNKRDITTLETTDEKCPECGKPVVVKLGRYGKFMSCSGYPDCKYSRPVDNGDGGDENGNNVDQAQLEGKCPECGGDLVLKTGRFGRFIACSNYPKCKYTKNYQEKIDMACPDCKTGQVVVKRTKRGKVFYGCSNYPECEFASWKRPQPEEEEKEKSDK